MCVEGCHRDLCLFHLYLVVFGMKVKFSEKLGSMKFIEEIINNWNREFIFDG